MKVSEIIEGAKYANTCGEVRQVVWVFEQAGNKYVEFSGSGMDGQATILLQSFARWAARRVDRPQGPLPSLQSTVARVVEARGYREGWSDDAYLARQMCKAVEELAELAESIAWGKRKPHWAFLLQ